MNAFILAIRNDINILNIAYTIIQIRKALNAIFHKVRYRGSFTIYAQAFKALKMNHRSVFSFITDWVPGLLSNYKRVTTAIKAYKLYNARTQYFLRRPQANAITHTHIKLIPTASTFRPKKRPSFIPKIPAISLSILDCSIWLHECVCLRIPSILLCDTQSHISKATYPIISNQRSIAISNLIVYLAAEVCNTSLMSSHLDFLSFYNYRGFGFIRSKTRIKQIMYTKLLSSKWFKLLQHRYKRDSKRIFMSYRLEFPRLKKKIIRKSFRKLRRAPRRSFRFFNQHFQNKQLALSYNKPTYIFNNRFFTYQIKDLIKNDATLYLAKYRHYFNLIRHKIYKHIRKLLKFLLHLNKCFRHLRKRRYFRTYGEYFKPLKELCHLMIITILGLKKALSRKKRLKRPYITKVPLKKRDIKSLMVCSFLLSPNSFNILRESTMKKDMPIKKVKIRSWIVRQKKGLL
jgi:ribosomal protein S2